MTEVFGLNFSVLNVLNVFSNIAREPQSRLTNEGIQAEGPDPTLSCPGPAWSTTIKKLCRPLGGQEVSSEPNCFEEAGSHNKGAVENEYSRDHGPE